MILSFNPSYDCWNWNIISFWIGRVLLRNGTDEYWYIHCKMSLIVLAYVTELDLSSKWLLHPGERKGAGVCMLSNPKVLAFQVCTKHLTASDELLELNLHNKIKWTKIPSYWTLNSDRAMLIGFLFDFCRYVFILVSSSLEGVIHIQVRSFLSWISCMNPLLIYIYRQQGANYSF